MKLWFCGFTLTVRHQLIVVYRYCDVKPSKQFIWASHSTLLKDSGDVLGTGAQKTEVLNYTSQVVEIESIP